MRVFRTIACVFVLSMALAACGGGGDEPEPAAVDTTTPTGVRTTAVRTSTTKANSGVSPCLTKEELAAIAGHTPDSLEERPHSAKGWPDGDCRYHWSALSAELGMGVELRSDAEKYYDDAVARAKANQYHEDMPSDVGDESYMSRGTGNRNVTGLIGLMYARQGNQIFDANYSDPQLKLRPTLAETAKLFNDIAAAQLAKAVAAR